MAERYVDKEVGTGKQGIRKLEDCNSGTRRDGDREAGR